MSDDTQEEDYQPRNGNLLSSIERYESGGRNVLNYRFQEDPSMYTASGYYQITNSTWKDGAKKAGVDLDKYPTAMSAPKNVQAKVADTLVDSYGMQPWSMNNKLMASLMGPQQQRGQMPAQNVQMASMQPQMPQQGLQTQSNPLMQQPQMPQLTPQQMQLAQYQRLQGLLQSMQVQAPQITGYTTA